MTDLWIASDWHLGPGSPAVHGRLALAFLERAKAAGVAVILNGDVFDDLFAGAGRASAAHPALAASIAALAASGRLSRTSGNHDPDAGPERLVLDRPGIGRILVVREVLKQAPAGFSAATKCFCTANHFKYLVCYCGLTCFIILKCQIPYHTGCIVCCLMHGSHPCPVFSNK